MRLFQQGRRAQAASFKLIQLVARRAAGREREDLAGIAGHLLEQQRTEGVDAGEVRLEVDGRAIVQNEPVEGRPVPLRRAQAAFIRI
jgi:hypothetical protein